MKNQRAIIRNGKAVIWLLAGVAGLATGCVERHVTYVGAESPPAYQAPPPPIETPAPEPAPPPEVMVAPAPVPPPGPTAPLRSARELEQMLAPIALYPDPLLAQILPAATLPSQVVLADRYLREGGDPNLIDLQLWAPSVKALARYPEVLGMLDQNLSWTTDLGTAFVNQPGEVMDAVQRLRAQALALGNLRSTPEQVVLTDGGTIEILPATPQVVYVPVYQPEVVYVQRPPEPNRWFISFGVGRPMGAWLNHDCDWREHHLIVWHHDHPRPDDWWTRRPEERRREQPANITVWHPRAGGDVAQRGTGDRGWGNRGDHNPAPVRPAPAPPVAHPAPPPVERHPEPVHSGAHPVPPAVTHPTPPPPVHSGAHQVPAPQEPPAAPVHSGAHLKPTTSDPNNPPNSSGPAPAPPTTRPLPSPKQSFLPPKDSSGREVPPPITSLPAPAKPTPTPPVTRPITSPKQPSQPARDSSGQPTPPPKASIPAPPTTVAHPAPAPAPRPQPEAARPAPVVPPQKLAESRPASGALQGIQSTRDTRESSQRGAQSHEAMSKPAPPPHAANSAGSGSPKAQPETKRK